MIEKILRTKADSLNIDRSNWELVKFGDVAIQQKETVNRETPELTRYVKGQHMGSEDLHLREWGELQDEYLGPAFIRRFDEGDILYGSRRTYLRKVVIAPFEGITSNTTFVIKANEKKIHKGILPFVMMSEGFTDNSIKNSKGSVNPYINWKDISNYEFLLPPKDQQAQLAELLWAMDEVVEREKMLLHSIKEYSVSFREKVVVESSQFIRLEKLISGITAGKSVNGVNKPASKEEKGVLKVSAVGPNGFDPNENKTITNQTDFDGRYAVRKGDVLITRANTSELVGRVCLVPDNYPSQMLCDKTLRLESHSGVDKHFLVTALSSRSIRNQIEGFATGTGGAMKNISQPEIRSLKIPSKSSIEQRSLGDTIRAINERIESISDKVKGSQTLQKSLINQIF